MYSRTYHRRPLLFTYPPSSPPSRPSFTTTDGYADSYAGFVFGNGAVIGAMQIEQQRYIKTECDATGKAVFRYGTCLRTPTAADKKKLGAVVNVKVESKALDAGDLLKFAEMAQEDLDVS